MNHYEEKRIAHWDKAGNKQLNDLLEQEGIAKDNNLEYTMGVFHEDKLVATGSYFKNTLRCLAVDSSYQGEGLLNKVISHLINLKAEEGEFHLFLYTKTDKTGFFKDLGFNEITRANDLAVFMENRKDGFSKYLDKLVKESPQLEGKQGAIIMNANPFTLGHLYLVETAAQSCDTLHIFVVREEASLVPFKVRYDLIKKGVSHLPNVVLHNTDSYMISSATFPSYFIKEEQGITQAQAEIDVGVFLHIAKALGISHRFVGDEPFSQVTNLYNNAMEKILGQNNIQLTILPRKENDGVAVSASQVRLHIHNGELEKIKDLVPASTYEFFQSPEGEDCIKKIQGASDVVHH